MVADGFPSSEHAHHSVTDCPACMSAKATRQSISKSLRPIGVSSKAAGQKWSMDFTRTFSTPDINQNQCAAVFMDVATGYLRVHLLRGHTDFWKHSKTTSIGWRRMQALTYATFMVTAI